MLALRDRGLVYSNQKPVNQTYAAWKASEYGQTVFMSRPVDVPAPEAIAGTQHACMEPVPQKPFRVLQVSDASVTLFDRRFVTQEGAQTFANTNIEKALPDVVNYVVTLHSSVKYVAPVAAGRDVVVY